MTFVTKKVVFFFEGFPKFDDVLLEHGGLPHVFPLAVLFEFFSGTPPSCLKVRGGWWVAYGILVSAPVPFGFSSYWDFVGVGPRWFWD